jgi:hypothetical protein
LSEVITNLDVGAPVTTALSAAVVSDTAPPLGLFLRPGFIGCIAVSPKEADLREADRAQRSDRIIFSVAFEAGDDRDRGGSDASVFSTDRLTPASTDLIFCNRFNLRDPSHSLAVKELNLVARSQAQRSAEIIECKAVADQRARRFDVGSVH